MTGTELIVCKNWLIKSPLLVISPHFDDAVLSCGHLLAMNPGAVVATICGGIAEDRVPASASWDSRGWESARAATLGRRQEDFDALECLGAIQYCANLLDYPYRTHIDDSEAFVDAIERLMDQWDAVRILVPLAGDTHRDHVLTRDAALKVLSSGGRTEIFLYADLPYFLRLDPKKVAVELHAELVVGAPTDSRALSAKRESVDKYRSQVPLLKRDFGRAFKSIFVSEVESLYRRDLN